MLAGIVETLRVTPKGSKKLEAMLQECWIAVRQEMFETGAYTPPPCADPSLL
jgi:hypothetical protein